MQETLEGMPNLITLSLLFDMLTLFFLKDFQTYHAALCSIHQLIYA